jgi:hypothetical protein
MTIVADGAEVTGLTTGGVAEEEEVRDLFFFRSAYRLSRKLFDRSKPLIHYPVFIPPKRGRKQAELACIKLWLPLHACDHCLYHARCFILNLCPPR